MTLTPEIDHVPASRGVDCPTLPIRLTDDQVAAAVAPVCLCSHQRSAHFGGRCICCDGECTAWRPRAGRRIARLLALSHELRAVPPVVPGPPIPHLGWLCPSRYRAQNAAE